MGPALVLVVALTLSVSSPAFATTPPVPDWSGPNISNARSVRRGLRLAHAYWHVIMPATVTIIDVSSEYLALTEVAPGPGAGYAQHIGVNVTALHAWPAGSALRSTQLPALIVHEYGHLLGYRDGVVYATDPRHVMVEYSNYLRVQPVLDPTGRVVVRRTTDDSRGAAD